MHHKQNKRIKFDITVEYNENTNMAKAIKTDITTDVTPDKHEKTLRFLREQLSIVEEEHKSYASLDFSMDTEMKIEKIVAQRSFFKLKSIIKAIESID